MGRLLFLILVTGVTCTVSAQPPDSKRAAPPSHYTAFDAMAESYQRGDARRRWLVGRQIALIQDQRRWNGLPPTVPLCRTGPDRVSFYAYGNQWDLPSCLPAFEPWPYVPGYVWGYQFDDPAPQPIDRRQVQTGPGRWVSYPVYPGEPADGEPLEEREYRGEREYIERQPVIGDEDAEQLPPPPPEPARTPTRVGPRKY